jgi:CysZ protein
MVSDFAVGFGYAFQGLSWLRRPRIRRYVVVPLMVNMLLFGALLWFGFEALGNLIDWLLSYLPGWLDFLRYLLWPLFALTALVVVFYTFTLVANLIAAPFNALLSERVEVMMTGRTPQAASGVKAVVKATGQAVSSELRKLLYLIGWSMPLLILFVIPGINLVAPLLWLTFGAWMLAIEYLDYPMGNRDMVFRQIKAEAKRRRGLSLGFGAGVLLMTSIPVLNFLAMPAGVVGATALWVDRMNPLSPGGSDAGTE